MIIPSIDLMAGQTVQLIGGREKVLEAGDPRPLAERFRLAGEIAVVDLDAALGRGSNAALIRELLPLAPCRVGGGIRDLATAIRWLDAGAAKVIIGTAATPLLLRSLPRERVIAALDARDGEVVVDGWQRGTGRGIVERMGELRTVVGGFLVTFVEREGRMEGTRLDCVAELVAAAGRARVTIAGGVTTPEEIAQLDRLGVDAQVGMALYTQRLEFADALAAPLQPGPQGLWPTVVTDETGIALGLAWSDRASLREAVRLQRGVYRSRSRGVWIKGETSGATQELVGIDLDCDRDCLRFRVRQQGTGFCHRTTRTCWGDDQGLVPLARRLARRLLDAPPESYTARLVREPALLRAKLLEEAAELAEATGEAATTHEAADLIYFTLVALARAGVALPAVSAALERRALRLTRRPGDAKPGPSSPDGGGD